MPRLLLAIDDANRLGPADAAAESWLGKQAAGEVVLCEIKKARHPAHHSKAFALLRFALANQETYPSVDVLLEAVKVATGHVEEIRFRSGDRIFYRTKSISFAALGQDEFSDWYRRMVDALAELTGIDAWTLENGAQEYEP